MKTHYLFFLSLFITAFCCFSCEKPETTDDDNDAGNYPIEVSFTEYSLYWGCVWKRPNLNEITIINSYEDLANYLNCPNDSFPEIDFSAQSLVYVCGVSSNGFCNISKKLMQTSKNNYKLNTEIAILDAVVEQKWNIALITDKLGEKSNIELNLTTAIKNVERNVWKFAAPDITGENDSVIIELTFYPSEHILYLKSTPETLNSRYRIRAIVNTIRPYCIIDGMLYFIQPNDEYFDKIYSAYPAYPKHFIDYLSENEIRWHILYEYDTTDAYYIRMYRFIRQTD